MTKCPMTARRLKKFAVNLIEGRPNTYFDRRNLLALADYIKEQQADKSSEEYKIRAETFSEAADIICNQWNGLLRNAAWIRLL